MIADETDEEELPQEVLDKMIDKGKIAEDTHQRLLGLREAGNPHIRKGLLLSSIQDDPAKSHVDKEKNRRDAIARIERRSVDATDVAGGEEDQEAPARPAVRPPKSRAVPEDSGISEPIFWVLGSLMLITAAASAFFFLRRGRH